MRHPILAAMTALCCFLLPTSPALAAAPKPAAAAASDVQVYDLPSKFRGQSYRIRVFTPAVAPPAKGFPVLFVTDSPATFNQAADAMRTRSIHELSPAIIVGIGYPSEDLKTIVRLRMIDMTPSRPNAAFMPTFSRWAQFSGSTPEDAGEAEDFFRFITTELLPQLERTQPIDRGNLALYGHSLGGLFALHCLFEHPEAFRTIIASSPSLPWNEQEILAGEPKLATALQRGVPAPRILLAAGSLEDYPTIAQLAVMPEADARAAIRQGQLTTGVPALAVRLRKLPGTEVQSVIFTDENHNSVIPASLSRALTFAFAPRAQR